MDDGGETPDGKTPDDVLFLAGPNSPSSPLK